MGNESAKDCVKVLEICFNDLQIQTKEVFGINAEQYDSILWYILPFYYHLPLSDEAWHFLWLQLIKLKNILQTGTRESVAKHL